MDDSLLPPVYSDDTDANRAALPGGDAPLIPPPDAQAPDAAPAPPTRPRLFWVLAGLAGLLLVVGIGLVAYYFYLTRSAAGASTSASPAPWLELAPADVSPALAVWTLTGIAPDQFYRQAMANGDIGSITAEALMSTDLPAFQRLGWLGVLARRAQAEERPELAATLFGVAADLAVLAPELNDRQRVESLTTAAAGLIPYDRAQAVALLDQVWVLAQYSPEFTPALRRQILDAAAAVYETAGERQKARTARALPAGTPASDPALLPDPFAPLAGPPPYGEAVALLVDARRQQAQVFVDAWIAGGGVSPRGPAQALAAALLDEDLARRAFYLQRLGTESLPAADRARVLWDQIGWLAIKHRASVGLFGDPLVANWTAERPAIRQQLHDAFVELAGVLLDTISTLPEGERPAARFALYRGLLAWSAVGLYPDADRGFLANALNDARGQWLAASGVLPRAEIENRDAIRFELTAASAGNS